MVIICRIKNKHLYFTRKFKSLPSCGDVQKKVLKGEEGGDRNSRKQDNGTPVREKLSILNQNTILSVKQYQNHQIVSLQVYSEYKHRKPNKAFENKRAKIYRTRKTFPNRKPLENKALNSKFKAKKYPWNKK